jgi:small GTP-binding protein
MQNYNINKFKLVLIGNSGVGKSSIIQRMVYNMFVVNVPPTIGAAYQTLKFDNKFIVDVWDTAGQERFQSLIPMYLKGTDIIFLVVSCDKTNEQIRQEIDFWLNFIQCNRSYINSDYKIFLIFNKCDINPNFKIPNEYLEDIQFYYMITTSAKTEKNIENIKLNIEKLCDAKVLDKNPSVNNNTSQSQFKFLQLPDITIPTSKTIKDFYTNSKCSIL